MGRKRPSELRRAGFQRRRRGTPTIPADYRAARRCPAWMKALGVPQRGLIGGRPPLCSVTSKRSYPNELAAAKALGNAQRDARRGDKIRKERRFYQCEHCSAWHLTGQEKRKSA